MNTIKLKLHSAVDLITNSSTVIFTYNDGALPSVKELVNEMLKVFGHEDKTFDDLFYAEVFVDSYKGYFESSGEETPWGEDWKDADKFIEDIKLQVIKGEIEKPDWMITAEEDETYYDRYTPPTSLEIVAKDEKYSELANKLLSYLNSPSHESSRDC